MYLADVPNVLLQTDWDIRVYGFDANYTKHDKRFNVVPRTRPENYVYTDVEQKTWEQLEERLDTIEENGVSDEQIETAVNKYLEENDIQVDLTDYYTKTETDAAISEAIANIDIPDVEPGEVDLSDYYTKSEVDQKVADAAVVVPNEVYVGTVEPTDSNVEIWINPEETVEYALKSDIPDTTGFITEEEATTLINEALGVIENGTY